MNMPNEDRYFMKRDLNLTLLATQRLTPAGPMFLPPRALPLIVNEVERDQDRLTSLPGMSAF